MKKLFRVYENDGTWTLNPIKYMGVFKASSKEEARQIASKYHNNKEISTTGFYSAEEITKSKLNKEAKELEELIRVKTKILN